MISSFVVVGLALGGLGEAPTLVSLNSSPRTAGFLLAQAETDVIETTDGKVHVGRILDETKAGYLLQPSSGAPYFVEFPDVKSVRRASAAPMSPAAAAPTSFDSQGGELDTIEIKLIALKREQKDWPVTGPTHAVVWGLLGVGGATAGLVFLAPPGNLGGWVALDVIGLVLSAVSIIVGIVFLIRNSGTYATLKEKIVDLETRREQLLERRSQGRGPQHPALAFNF